MARKDNRRLRESSPEGWGVWPRTRRGLILATVFGLFRNYSRSNYLGAMNMILGKK